MDATQDNEQWLPIPGYEGWYEVGDQGHVRSVDRLVRDVRCGSRRLTGKLLKPGLGLRGYPFVNLYRDGKSKAFKVHHLVAKVFLGPRPDGLHICHFNDIKTDNRATNLRYATQSDNMFDRVRNGGHPNAEKKHCANGHEFTPENTASRHGRGGRTCRECKRIQDRDAKRREAQRNGTVRVQLTHCKRGHEFTPENTYVNPAHGGRVCRKCQRLHQERSQGRRAGK